MDKKIRVLVAKPGLDGHDRGALIISQALRDHGMEVIYTGLRQTPEQIVAAAIQEDVDAIGLSSLSGAHNELFPDIVTLLKKRGSEDILVIGGGVIPFEDIPFLESKGIKKIFTPGSTTDDIAHYIKQAVYERDGIVVSNISEPKKVDHIGIAVKSIDDALPFYLDQLHMKLEAIEEVPSEKVKVAFLKVGETRLELLESLEEDGPIAKFIKKRGEGVHHIALGVDQLNERLVQLKEQGIPLINETAKKGAHNSMIAFIHPKAATGVLVELCEKQIEEDKH